jgi:glycosyltransferase involved in cell wall biosynthesis
MNKNIFIVEEGSNPSTDYFVLPALSDPVNMIQRCQWDQLPKASELVGSTVIFIRYIPRAWLRLINEVRSTLADLIYFMDDDLLDLSSTKGLPWRYRFKIASLATWQKNWLIRTQVKIWVSTPYLKEKYARLNPTLLLPQPIKASNDICRVFYHGSATHNDEINWLYQVIKEVLTKNEKIVFEIIGGTQVNKRYRTLPRVNVIHPMKWPAYQAMLATSGRHIGLAPISDTPFNQSRSYTKFFDITRAGAAGIYASRYPYQSIVIDKKNGLLIDRDTDSWVNAILLLSNNEYLRNQIIEEAYLTVKMLDNQLSLAC